MTHTAPNAPLAYNIYGKGQPLLLLHGALVDRDYWQPQLAVFSCRYQVITCDLPGHGQSRPLNGHTSASDFAQNVLALLDYLGLSRVICVGHSFGGMIAQELAVQAPERIAGLVLADTWYYPRGEWWEPLPFRTVGLTWLLWGMRVEDSVALMATGLGLLNPAIRPYASKVMGRYKNSRAQYLQIWDAAISYNSAPRLHQIACPTLITVSELFAFSRWQSHQMQRRIPNAEQVIIPRSGHWLNWDNPHAFSRSVLEFLERRVQPALSR